MHIPSYDALFQPLRS